MTYDVFFVQFDEADAFYTLQNLDGLHESGSLRSGKVNLCHVSRDNHFGVHTHTGEKHLDLLGSRVLGFVQNNYGIIQRTSTHESQRGNLDDIQLHVFLQLGSRNHVLQGIVQRLQVGVDFILHVAWQETQFLTRLHGRAAQDDFFDFLVLQCPYCQCNGGIGLTRTGGTDGKNHVILFKLLHQFQLVLASGDDGLTRYAEHDGVSRLFRFRRIAFYDVENRFLIERVILHAIFFQCKNGFFEGTHFLLISHDLDDIAACHYSQFREQGLDHLYVGVVGAVEDYRVDIFEYNMFLYHLACSDSLICFIFCKNNHNF